MVMKTTATFDLIDDFAAASPAPRSAVRPPTENGGAIIPH